MEEQMNVGEEKKSGLTLPGAIVIAGVLIALAIVGGFVYMKNSGGAEPAGVAGGAPNVRSVGKTDYVLGDAKAPIQIITYTDLECPYCKVFHNTLMQVYKDYGTTGKVAIIYRNFPIASLHSKANEESAATLCAGQQGGTEKYWGMVDKIFSTTNSNNSLDLTLLPKFATELGLDQAKFAKCLTSSAVSKQIDKEIAEAGKYGAQGTPFPIFMYKGEFKGYIPGALPYTDTKDAKSGQTITGIKTIIEQLLAGK